MTKRTWTRVGGLRMPKKGPTVVMNFGFAKPVKVVGGWWFQGYWQNMFHIFSFGYRRS